MGEVVNISGVNIYTLGLFSVIAFLWGSYVFYKKGLSTHFEENSILDVVVVCGFWSFILGRLVYVLENLPIFFKHWSRVFLMADFPGVSRWGVLIGFVLGAMLVIRKKKGKYFDYFDLLALAYFGGMQIFLSLMLLSAFTWQRLALAILHFIFYLIFWRMEEAYRHFAWYRGSKTFARTGLVAGFSISAIGLLYFVELVINKTLWPSQLILGAVLSVLGLVLVYSRSGRILVDDLSVLKIWNKRKQK